MDLATWLTPPKTIAVIGLSDKSDRPSYLVAAYLQKQGFRIIPVNPALTEVLGEKAYPSLSAIPPSIQIDIVDVFRKPEVVAGIVGEIVASDYKPLLWLQEGVVNAAAKAKAESFGLEVVMDVCLMKTHQGHQT
jgi:predicted CoA-binding protein